MNDRHHADGPPDELDDVLDLIAAEQAHPRPGYDDARRHPRRHRRGARRRRARLDPQRPGGPSGRPHRRRGGRRLGRRGRPGLDPRPLGRRRRRRLAPWARPLVEVVLDQLPESIHDWELAADVTHTRMAELGAELGLPASEVNHVYSVDAATVETWPEPVRGGPDRPPTRMWRPSVRCTTRSSPRRTRPPTTWFPSLPTASSMSSSRRTGRSSSATPPDGSSPTARGTSTSSPSRTSPAAGASGRDLMVAVCRPVIASATTGKLHLTVQDHRAPARRLYESLGFQTLPLDRRVPPHIGVVPCVRPVNPVFGPAVCTGLPRMCGCQAAQASGSGSGSSEASTGAPWASAPPMGWGRRKTPPTTAARAAITAPAAKATW